MVCYFCGVGVFSSKQLLDEHEIKCFKNPKNRIMNKKHFKERMELNKKKAEEPNN